MYRKGEGDGKCKQSSRRNVEYAVAGGASVEEEERKVTQ